MRYATSLYARALVAVMRDGRLDNASHAAKRFMSLIQRNGDAAHASQIVRNVERRLLREEGGRHVVVETARPVAEGISADVKDAFTDKDVIEKVVRPDLVAGVRIVIDGEREFDGSLKRALTRMFNR